MVERIGTAVFPSLPDMDPTSQSLHFLTPHPDGRAWRKACGECALRTSDPQQIGYSYQQWIADGIPGHLFYCIHRYDGDFVRVCACYAALHPEQSDPGGRPNG